MTAWTTRPKHLQRWIDPRTGRERVAFRRPGAPKIELKSPWGTQALVDEVAALVASIRVRPAPGVGTIVGAVQAYRRSAEYLSLAPATQIEYDRWLDRFERVTFPGVLLADIDAGYILDLRDGWAKRGYRAANLALQILKNVCKAPMIRGEIEGDPFARIDKVARPQSLGETNPRWEDGEVEAVIEWALARKLPGLARAVALGRWGGFRKQTIIALPRGARITREGERRLYWVTQKKLVRCDRREDARLTDLLARTEASERKGGKTIAPLTIAYNGRGEAWTARALGHALERALVALGPKGEGKARGSLTWHGLRHARGVELAAAGASDAEIMAQLDHATPRAAAIYRRQAERLKLADAAQDRVDAEVVRLAGRRKSVRQSPEG